MDRAIEMILVTAAAMELDAQDSAPFAILRPAAIRRRVVALDLLDYAEERALGGRGAEAQTWASPFHT